VLLLNSLYCRVTSGSGQWCCNEKVCTAGLVVRAASGVAMKQLELQD
jgi:hypothetical protein